MSDMSDLEKEIIRLRNSLSAATGALRLLSGGSVPNPKEFAAAAATLYGQEWRESFDHVKIKPGGERV